MARHVVFLWNQALELRSSNRTLSPQATEVAAVGSCALWSVSNKLPFPRVVVGSTVLRGQCRILSNFRLQRNTKPIRIYSNVRRKDGPRERQAQIDFLSQVCHPFASQVGKNILTESRPITLEKSACVDTTFPKCERFGV